MTVGNYWSIQGGADYGVRPVGSADILVEANLYFDQGKYQSSLSGPFFAEGGEGAFGLSLGGESIQALLPNGEGKVDGLSVTLGVGSPDISGHVQFGYGGIYDGSTEDVKFSDLPSYFFNRWTYGVFR